MNIIFVCTGNTCRSPMAEGYFRDLCDKANIEINISSAGIAAGNGMRTSQNSINALKKYDIDISELRSSPLTLDDLEKNDLIITMGNSHKAQIVYNVPESESKIHLLLEYMDCPNDDVADPFGGNQEIYNACFAEMKPALDNLLLDLIAKLT